MRSLSENRVENSSLSRRLVQHQLPRCHPLRRRLDGWNTSVASSSKSILLRFKQDTTTVSDDATKGEWSREREKKAGYPQPSSPALLEGEWSPDVSQKALTDPCQLQTLVSITLANSHHALLFLELRRTLISITFGFGHRIWMSKERRKEEVLRLFNVSHGDSRTKKSIAEKSIVEQSDGRRRNKIAGSNCQNNFQKAN
ncbi:hypothetical protein ACLOJK_035984 [Asimina triloba]